MVQRATKSKRINGCPIKIVDVVIKKIEGKGCGTHYDFDKYPIENFKYPIKNFKYPIKNIKYPIKNFKYQIDLSLKGYK